MPDWLSQLLLIVSWFIVALAAGVLAFFLVYVASRRGGYHGAKQAIEEDKQQARDATRQKPR